MIETLESAMAELELERLRSLPLPSGWGEINGTVAPLKLSEIERERAWVAEEYLDTVPAMLTIMEPGQPHRLTDSNWGSLLNDSLCSSMVDDPMLVQSGLKPYDRIVGYLETGPEWADMQAQKRGYRRFHFTDVLRYQGMSMESLPYWQRRVAVEEIHVSLDRVYRERVRRDQTQRYAFPYLISISEREGFGKAFLRSQKNKNLLVLKKLDEPHKWVEVR